MCALRFSYSTGKSRLFASGQKHRVGRSKNIGLGSMNVSKIARQVKNSAWRVKCFWPAYFMWTLYFNILIHICILYIENISTETCGCGSLAARLANHQHAIVRSGCRKKWIVAGESSLRVNWPRAHCVLCAPPSRSRYIYNIWNEYYIRRLGVYIYYRGSIFWTLGQIVSAKIDLRSKTLFDLGSKTNKKLTRHIISRPPFVL
jgi:hypothetical protein